MNFYDTLNYIFIIVYYDNQYDTNDKRMITYTSYGLY